MVKNTFLKDYYSELSDYFLSGGKRIRPLLCIATYNAFNEKPNEKIIQASVGTEFLHNASLIHDDIIDKDDFRRGKPSFHYRFRQYHSKYDLKKMVAEDFGMNLGILGGDTSFYFGLEAYLFNEFEKELNLRAIQYYEQVFHEVRIIHGFAYSSQLVFQLPDFTARYALKRIQRSTVPALSI